MKKRMIYLLMAAIGTVGFTGCGSGQNTTQDGTGTYDSTTGTQMGTQNNEDRAGTTMGTTGNQTATTGTSGTRTTTGTTGTTTGNAGMRTSNDGTGMNNGTGTSPTTQASGQTTATNNATNRPRNNFELSQATDYSFNNENFRFSPDAKGISITRDKDGSPSPFGTMRSFGNDGYYMVTTTNTMGEEEFSVGRFDEQGNFTVYRYDSNGDRVTEQNYRSGNSMNRNNR